MNRFRRAFYKFTEKNINDILAYNIKSRARYSKEDHLNLLLAASLVNGFTEGVSRSLNFIPTGETLLSYIKSQKQTTIQNVFDGLVGNSVMAVNYCALKGAAS